MLTRFATALMFFMQSSLIPVAMADGMPTAEDVAVRIGCLKPYYNNNPTERDLRAQSMLVDQLIYCENHGVDDDQCFSAHTCDWIEDHLTEAGLACPASVCPVPSGNNLQPAPITVTPAQPPVQAQSNNNGLFSNLGALLPLAFLCLSMFKQNNGRHYVYRRSYYPGVRRYTPPVISQTDPYGPGLHYIPGYNYSGLNGSGNGGLIFSGTGTADPAPPIVSYNGATTTSPLGIGTLPGVTTPTQPAPPIVNFN